METAPRNYSEITPDILKYSELCHENSTIDLSLYKKYDVKRGLRDVSGEGVLTGLTEISEIFSGKFKDLSLIHISIKIH